MKPVGVVLFEILRINKERERERERKERKERIKFPFSYAPAPIILLQDELVSSYGSSSYDDPVGLLEENNNQDR